MAAFKFKLESVLRQRQMEEDQRQRDLAKLLRQRMIFHNELQTMQRSIVESKRDLAGGLVGRVDLGSVSGFARYSGQLAQRAHAIVARLAGLEKQIAPTRQRLIEASRARRAIERLRERHYRQWLLQMQRREASQLDEIGVTRFAYRVMAEAS